MAFLPPEQTILTGSCLCTAVAYTITIPPLASRPLFPNALPTPVDNTTSPPTMVDTRLPLIDMDHCNSCRRACGGLIQCWLICPQDWVEFRLLSRQEEGHASVAEREAYPTASVVSNPSKELLERTYLGHYSSSPQVHRCFCSRCGTGLTWCTSRDRGPKWTLGAVVDIAVGTLDRASIERVRADRHMWWDDGVEWVRRMVSEGDGGLIKHPTYRLDEEVAPVAGASAGVGRVG
ncbi:hypothetical protein N656DRAFT_776947 [Canariomyces notabilis]|uniref:CENP-V/GFA domain-containing protein n=1 Tax=Canariomyces notabilis TaxID=2074819 RepID=A0AAN6TJ03_9PEZI|nr:hypothetical protein N656DRAFT_776947 [Canariomyces arenarius]